ncbi:hypothetical protein LAC81_02015 [Ensifer adhaerens]|nr:hypothetical protein [Ensifer adhaerens]MBZ7920562.1 hypothetical protein [Ensifer adhaerens]UAX93038.1 hypothetical protein LAC78_02010 [Ensifer adhaerens]UAY00674.1 hypothetical protein LAC80_02015 [Ensifer adhaerens]UAY08055.1 hypothetical protein LAC81_02015 [Ensifer adhaerens]
MEFDHETERGIQMFMAEHGLSREDAIKRIIHDWLIGGGYIPFDSDHE